MKTFKHRSVFENQIIRAAHTIEVEQDRSFASLDGLSKLKVPESIDLSNNPDLLLVTYNGAVINRMNRNDDGISTATAMAIKNQFIHKPTNIEHKKKRTVGHIVGVGWSTFGGNELLTDEEAAAMTEPFNLVISSVVYRANEEKLSDALIDSTDETSPLYQSISSSWEIAFEDYQIILGSKNTDEGEIITDPKLIEKYKKYLKAYGGKGQTEDGVYVGRLIVGDESSVLPVGFAYTSNPAAEVKGVVVRDFSDDEEDEEEDEIEDNSTHHNESEELAASVSDEAESARSIFSEKDDGWYLELVKAVQGYKIAAKKKKS